MANTFKYINHSDYIFVQYKMVKNTSGGNKAKSKARKTQTPNVKKLDDIKAGDDQEYAKVLKVNGGGRYVLLCMDEKERLGVARGKINRNVRIGIDNLLLISRRDFQDDKCDILYAYTVEEMQLLFKHKQIPDKLQSNLDKHQSDDIAFGEEQEVAFEDL